MEDPIKSLRGYLSSIPPTENLSSEQVDHLIPLLKKGWWYLSGAGEGKMGKGKLERIEQVSWAPPNLRFIVERHGGTVMGSSRAELIRWTVDVNEGIASSEPAGHRQLYKMAGRLNVRLGADEILDIIAQDKDDVRLRWSPDRQRVTILLRRTLEQAAAEQGVPSGYASTMEGRTKRLKKELTPRLEAAGWIPLRGNMFAWEKV